MPARVSIARVRRASRNERAHWTARPGPSKVASTASPVSLMTRPAYCSITPRCRSSAHSSDVVHDAQLLELMPMSFVERIRQSRQDLHDGAHIDQPDHPHLG